MRWLRKSRGQSTLEYVIVLTAIVAAVIAATPVIREKVQGVFEHATDEMGQQVEKLDYGN